MSDQFAELWQAAIEEQLSQMPEPDFQELVARVRPPGDPTQQCGTPNERTTRNAQQRT